MAIIYNVLKIYKGGMNMIEKYLEKKVELGFVETLKGCKNPIELEYYLLESNINDIDELKGKKVYGVEIIKKVNDIRVENNSVQNLFCCKESTKYILNKLANNTVTPVGLPFILDDIIGI